MIDNTKKAVDKYFMDETDARFDAQNMAKFDVAKNGFNRLMPLNCMGYKTENPRFKKR